MSRSTQPADWVPGLEWNCYQRTGEGDEAIAIAGGYVTLEALLVFLQDLSGNVPPRIECRHEQAGTWARLKAADKAI